MLIHPLISIWSEVRIKNDYTNNIESNLYSNFYLDKFKYNINISNKWIKINIFYWFWKVNTEWFREMELIINEKRDFKTLLNNIKNSLEINIWDLISLWNKISHDSQWIFYINNWEKNIQKIEEININWIIEPSYHPIKWEKLKENYSHETFEYIIWWNKFINNDFEKI